MKPETVLAIFTFSPVQSFISEARRAEDLFNGSQILSRLAHAAAQGIGGENLIYPASLSRSDMPNKLVARLPMAQAEEILQNVELALIGEWRKIAADARQKANLESDDLWQKIWQRQVIQNPPWQVFWAFWPESGDYTADFREAGRILDALKHSRIFSQSEEDGDKDSLSGQRSALRTAQQETTRDYWKCMAGRQHITASRLKPGGTERLDSIGLIKRFAELAPQRPFPSTSTVAGWDFYQQAKIKAANELQAYRAELDQLGLYEARPYDKDFSYDLDVLFKETLTVKRMKDSYQKEFTDAQLKPAQKARTELVKAVGGEPSPYYAILMLDGDGIGKKLDVMKGQNSTGETFHRQFSQKLNDFAGKAATLVNPDNGGFLVYNGGDDVLLLASLQNAIRLAGELAQAYQEAFRGLTEATLSGAVLIAHHLSPLRRVLADLRDAEKYAKAVKKDDLHNKDTLCVALSKRGGEPLLARSPWSTLRAYQETWIESFDKGDLANSLPYLLGDDLRVAENLEFEAVKALVSYRFQRQAGEGFKTKAAELSEEWLNWVLAIEQKLNGEHKSASDVRRTAFEEAVNWLVIARFLAQGGKE